LWDCVGPVATVLLQQRQNIVLLFAGVCGVQRGELLVYNGPGCILLVCVFDVRNTVAVLVIQGIDSDGDSSLAVLWIGEARMISVQISTILHGLGGKEVQIGEFAREPRHLLHDTRGRSGRVE